VLHIETNLVGNTERKEQESPKLTILYHFIHLFYAAKLFLNLIILMMHIEERNMEDLFVY